MNEQQKKQAEKDNLELIKRELMLFGAPQSPLKRTGSGGYLGHGKGSERPDYKPCEDYEYKVQPK